MFRLLFLGVLLAYSTIAQAQPSHTPSMTHSAHTGLAVSGGPTEPGQAAFAAIQEIVSILAANPATDWSMVNIDALRRHLADMDNVTLRSSVTATPLDNGMRYLVTGTGAVRDSIARMILAHAKTVSGDNGMTIKAAEHLDGAVMTVTVANQADMLKLKGLGFFGILTLGMHHQAHHLGIAAGHEPHR